MEELEKLLGGQEFLALSPRLPAAASNANGYRNGWGRGNGSGSANGRYVPGRAAGAPAGAE